MIHKLPTISSTAAVIGAVAALAAVAGCAVIPDTPHGAAADATWAPACAAQPGTLGDMIASHPPLALDDGVIRLVTWNVHRNHDDGWQEHIAALREVSDVMLLQEAKASSELRQSFGGAGFHWRVGPAFYHDDAEVGVLTAANVQDADSCMLSTMEPLLRIPKKMLISRYPIAGSGQSLLVANVHFVNFTLGEATYRSQLEQLESQIGDHDGPVIIAGDFNTWSEARHRLLDASMARLGLQAVEFAGKPSEFLGRVVDHVFYRDLAFIDSAVRDMASSDHKPLYAAFRLSRTP